MCAEKVQVFCVCSDDTCILSVHRQYRCCVYVLQQTQDMSRSGTQQSGNRGSMNAREDSTCASYTSNAMGDPASSLTGKWWD